MDLSLIGKTALITGGSLGLGLATATAYYQAGARVGILARRSAPLDEAVASVSASPVDGADIRGYICDVADADQVAATHSRLVDELGSVDILVNNAGKSAARPFMEITDAEWREDLDLKLFGAIRLTRLIWPGMVERRWGRIINVLNTAAKAPPPGSAPTSVSRAAGMALTKVLAGEGAPHNVLVNAMLIGFIKSDQVVRQHAAANTSQSLEDFTDAAGARLPMGRMGEAQEVANLALFLASNAASYVTGCAINMDGGLARVV